MRRLQGAAWRSGLRAPASLAAILVLAVSAVAMVSPAQAASTFVSVSGGVLSVAVPAVNDFAVVALDGTAQTASAGLEPFSVTDARGTGQGWTLNIQATGFREWDGTTYVPAGQALPPGSLSLPGLSVTPEGADATAPAVVAGPFTLDTSGVTVATASAGSGMGRFTFSPTGALRVAVPADAYARTYRSELSVSVTSGP